MYAVIKTGGKQHVTRIGDLLRIEKVDVEAGKSLEFSQVLVVANEQEVKIGTPYVENAKVSAEVVSHARHKKINIIKFKRRKHHMKRMGHRQWFTEVKITAIKEK